MEDRLAKKKAQIAILMERTSEVRKMKEELQQKRSEVLINMNANVCKWIKSCIHFSFIIILQIVMSSSWTSYIVTLSSWNKLRLQMVYKLVYYTSWVWVDNLGMISLYFYCSVHKMLTEFILISNFPHLQLRRLCLESHTLAH